jgi:hypothetical protein
MIASTLQQDAPLRHQPAEKLKLETQPLSSQILPIAEAYLS